MDQPVSRILCSDLGAPSAKWLIAAPMRDAVTSVRTAPPNNPIAVPKAIARGQGGGEMNNADPSTTAGASINTAPRPINMYAVASNRVS
jgi:hypothetical protein